MFSLVFETIRLISTCSTASNANSGNTWGPSPFSSLSRGSTRNLSWSSSRGKFDDRPGKHSDLFRTDADVKFLEGTGWNSDNIFTGVRRHSRAVMIRLLTIEALRRLSSHRDNNGHTREFHPTRRVAQQVEFLSPLSPQITLHEMLEIFETEGDALNGGGMFSVKSDAITTPTHGDAGDFLVAYEPDDSSGAGRDPSLSGSGLSPSTGYVHKPGAIGTVPPSRRGTRGSGGGGSGSHGMSRSASGTWSQTPSATRGSRRASKKSRPPWFY